MLYALEENDKTFIVKERFSEVMASELGVAEKAIENWIAENPQLLFPREKVLVFAQSVAGQSMADVLALDAVGNLLIVEIKRDWSDRSTVSQLLEYAAEYRDCPYETFNQLAKQYKKWVGGELIERFMNFAERKDFSQRQLCKHQRVFIVAPDSDAGLKRIVDWLRSYSVPIEFVPFRLLADAGKNLKFIEISGTTSETETEPQTENDGWAGHWIFNTNETHSPGAYEKMFQGGVIAIYGYENLGANLEGSAVDQKVFAYVNGEGIRGLGRVVDAVVRPGTGIFLDEKGAQKPDEYHLAVSWEVVLPRQLALSNSEASAMGYSLPVRTVFGRLHRGRLASQIETEIRKRGDSTSVHSEKHA